MSASAKGVVLGIDVGTTGVRAAVFTEAGVVVADASISCPHDAPRPGWAEADPEAWWRSVIRVLGELARTTKLADVVGVAVAGQAPTVVLVDDAGAVVRPAILWLDTRADAEAKELGTEAYYLGPKLLWLARHDPKALARAKWMLQSHAFVGLRMTGEVAVDPSTAALALPLFDLGALDWVHTAFTRVHDTATGAGITPADLTRIFEPFFSRKRLADSSGSGLGLAIVHGVVKEHGGYIDVVSDLGHGTPVRALLCWANLNAAAREREQEERLAAGQSGCDVAGAIEEEADG